MQIVLEKVIDNKLAQLVLADDNITVQVIYDGIVIDESAGGTWNNISNGLEEGYLSIIIDSYLEHSVQDIQFNKLVKRFRW